jgi:NTE family protein
MQELRDTNITYAGRPTRLLDEVDYISSVSGGSFTSAYYGLHGDGIFENFENDFLRFNLEKHLIIRTLNPFLAFSKKGRTESAIAYYQKFLFHDATFADMIRPDRPMIIINASDLGYGIRFSFIQEYFDLLCSELSTYPVADAVAASSAVPVLFNPIVMKNYDTCRDMQLIGTKRLHEAEEVYKGENLPLIISQLETYADKDKRKFVHFVDGGITDNLGLRAVSDIMSITGNSYQFIEKAQKPPRHVVILLVDATTERTTDMDISNKEPSAVGVMGAVTNLQLTRYDYDSKTLVMEKLDKWAAALSTPELPVKTHFISVSIQDVKDPKNLAYLNSIPTSFALKDEQVDRLTATGRELLRDNPEFQRLLKDLESQ